MEDQENRYENVDGPLKKNRRTSILKEIADNEKLYEVTVDTKASSCRRSLKRVSFADTTSIKEFLATQNANYTEWHDYYEEPVCQRSSLVDLTCAQTETNLCANAGMAPETCKEQENPCNDSYNEAVKQFGDFMSNFCGFNPGKYIQEHVADKTKSSENLSLTLENVSHNPVLPLNTENANDADMLCSLDVSGNSMNMNCAVQTVESHGESLCILKNSSYPVGEVTETCVDANMESRINFCSSNVSMTGIVHEGQSQSKLSSSNMSMTRAVEVNPLVQSKLCTSMTSMDCTIHDNESLSKFSNSSMSMTRAVSSKQELDAELSTCSMVNSEHVQCSTNTGNNDTNASIIDKEIAQPSCIHNTLDMNMTCAVNERKKLNDFSKSAVLTTADENFDASDLSSKENISDMDDMEGTEPCSNLTKVSALDISRTCMNINKSMILDNANIESAHHKENSSVNESLLNQTKNATLDLVEDMEITCSLNAVMRLPFQQANDLISLESENLVPKETSLENIEIVNQNVCELAAEICQNASIVNAGKPQGNLGSQDVVLKRERTTFTSNSLSSVTPNCDADKMSECILSILVKDISQSSDRFKFEELELTGIRNIDHSPRPYEPNIVKNKNNTENSQIYENKLNSHKTSDRGFTSESDTQQPSTNLSKSTAANTPDQVLGASSLEYEVFKPAACQELQPHMSNKMGTLLIDPFTNMENRNISISVDCNDFPYSSQRSFHEKDSKLLLHVFAGTEITSGSVTEESIFIQHAESVSSVNTNDILMEASVRGSSLEDEVFVPAACEDHSPHKSYKIDSLLTDPIMNRENHNISISVVCDDASYPSQSLFFEKNDRSNVKKLSKEKNQVESGETGSKVQSFSSETAAKGQGKSSQTVSGVSVFSEMYEGNHNIITCLENVQTESSNKLPDECSVVSFSPKESIIIDGELPAPITQDKAHANQVCFQTAPNKRRSDCTHTPESSSKVNSRRKHSKLSLVYVENVNVEPLQEKNHISVSEKQRINEKEITESHKEITEEHMADKSKSERSFLNKYSRSITEDGRTATKENEEEMRYKEIEKRLTNENERSIEAEENVVTKNNKDIIRVVDEAEVSEDKEYKEMDTTKVCEVKKCKQIDKTKVFEEKHFKEIDKKKVCEDKEYSDIYITKGCEDKECKEMDNAKVCEYMEYNEMNKTKVCEDMEHNEMDKTKVCEDKEYNEIDKTKVCEDKEYNEMNKTKACEDKEYNEMNKTKVCEDMEHNEIDKTKVFEGKEYNEMDKTKVCEDNDGKEMDKTKVCEKEYNEMDKTKVCEDKECEEMDKTKVCEDTRKVVQKDGQNSTMRDYHTSFQQRSNDMEIFKNEDTDSSEFIDDVHLGLVSDSEPEVDESSFKNSSSDLQAESVPVKINTVDDLVSNINKKIDIQFSLANERKKLICYDGLKEESFSLEELEPVRNTDSRDLDRRVRECLKRASETEYVSPIPAKRRSIAPKDAIISPHPEYTPEANCEENAEALCRKCQLIVNKRICLYDFEVEASREGWIQLRLQRRPLKVLLDLMYQDDHCLVIKTDWRPKGNDLNNPVASLACKIFGDHVTESVGSLAGVRLCNLKPELKKVVHSFNVMMYFLGELFLIHSLFITSFTDDGLKVILGNPKAVLSVSLNIKLLPTSSKQRKGFTMHIEPAVEFGSLRKESLETAIKSVDDTECKLLNSIRCVDDIVQNMTH